MTSIFENKKLCVFDFDETLISAPDHKIKVVRESGEIIFLNAADWNSYTPSAADQFDFSGFEKVLKPTLVEKPWKIFLERLGTHGFENVHILSARGHRKPMDDFFDSMKIKVQISCLGIAPGENNGFHKALWIENKIKNENVSIVEFFDDRKDCVTSVLDLADKYENIVFYVWQVVNGELVKATRKD